MRLYANIECPEDAETIEKVGGDGVGLFRTEFLVVGRSSMPGEEEQYEAYRHLAETFPD